MAEYTLTPMRNTMYVDEETRDCPWESMLEPSTFFQACTARFWLCQLSQLAHSVLASRVCLLPTTASRCLARVRRTQSRWASPSSRYYRSLSSSASSKPAQIAQPGLSRSAGGYPQRKGLSQCGCLFLFGWFSLRSEVANVGVFDLCHLGLLK